MMLQFDSPITIWGFQITKALAYHPSQKKDLQISLAYYTTKPTHVLLLIVGLP